MNQVLLTKVKISELAKFLIDNYNYQEATISNVNGVFLENRAEKYQLVRISHSNHGNAKEFIDDYELLKVVVAEYQRVAQLDTVKCLNICFGTTQTIEDDSITYANLEEHDLLVDNALLNEAFPNITTSEEIAKADNFLLFRDDKAIEKHKDDPMLANFTSLLDINKKTRFTRYFMMVFLILNIYVMFVYNNIQTYEYQFSFYDAFFTQLKQYYRLLTGLFINNDFLFIIFFMFLFYRYNTYLELKIGTKKTVLFYGLGLAFIFVTMLFVRPGVVIFGSYPLACLMAGGYIATLTLEARYLKGQINLPLLFSFVFAILVLGIFNDVDLILAMLSLLIGLALAYALNLESEKIHIGYLSACLVMFVFAIGSSYFPDQTLSRATSFEQGYLSYLNKSNPEFENSVAQKLNLYYNKLGVVNYD